MRCLPFLQLRIREPLADSVRLQSARSLPGEDAVSLQQAFMLLTAGWQQPTRTLVLNYRSTAMTPRITDPEPRRAQTRVDRAAVEAA